MTIYLRFDEQKSLYYVFITLTKVISHRYNLYFGYTLYIISDKR